MPPFKTVYPKPSNCGICDLKQYGNVPTSVDVQDGIMGFGSQLILVHSASVRGTVVPQPWPRPREPERGGSAHGRMGCADGQAAGSSGSSGCSLVAATPV